MPTSIFISYSHDSDTPEQQVLALANKLRHQGIDVRLDQYETHPSEGWPRWTERQLDECDFVLLICTPTYRRRYERQDAPGAGDLVEWEALIIERLLVEAGARNDKLLPVLLPEGTEQDIPQQLRSFTHYRLPEAYEALYRRLTDQPKTPAPPLGEVVSMPANANSSAPMSADLRDVYLQSVLSYCQDRRPLRDLFRDDDLIPPSLGLRDIEVPTFVEPMNSPIRHVNEQPLRRSLYSLVSAQTEEQSPPITILGDVGVGKTTLLEQTASAFAERALEDPTRPLPVLVPARDLVALRKNNRKLDQHFPPPPRQLLAEPNPRWIYLIDGYDEVSQDERGELDRELRHLLADTSVAGMAITSRPVGPPHVSNSRDFYTISAWTQEDRSSFLRRWKEEDPRVTIQQEFWSNPLTATLSAALSRDTDDGATRSELFERLISHLFSEWASSRISARSVSWRDIAPICARLAATLLARGEDSFSRRDILMGLETVVAPEEERNAWLDMRKLFGILRKRTDNRYEFLLKPIAEFLAGESLRTEAPCRLSKIATEAWATEPVRHCIGLHARHDTQAALQHLHALLQPHDNEEHAAYSLRRAMIAARAASDMESAPESVAAAISDNLLEHLFDETSNWRPVYSSQFIRGLLSDGGMLGRVLAERATRRLEIQVAQTGKSFEASAATHDLSHRSPFIRIGAILELKDRMNESGVRSILCSMLYDGGVDRYCGDSVAIAAAQILRGAERDALFEEDVLPALKSMLGQSAQLLSGAAAVALLPNEAPIEQLLEALNRLPEGFAVPDEVRRDLLDAQREKHPEGPFFLIHTANRMMWPNAEPVRTRYLRARCLPSPFVRRNIIHAIGASKIHTDERQIVDLVDGARRGEPAETEVLCELALTNPTLLVGLIDDTINDFDSPRLESRKTRLRLTPSCIRLLEPALAEHQILFNAIIRLWVDTNGSIGQYGAFPGELLEPAILAGDESATLVYSSWLPTVLSGFYVPVTISSSLLEIPRIRQTARRFSVELIERTFRGETRNGERSVWRLHGTEELLKTLRPVWHDDPKARSILEESMRGKDTESALYAMRLVGASEIPAGIISILATIIQADPQGPGSQSVSDQVNAILFSMATDLPSRMKSRLLEISNGASQSRFAAAIAVLPLLDEDEAQRLSSALARSGPGPDRWLYTNRETLLRELIPHAPLAWAERLEQGRDIWDFSLARLVLENVDGRKRQEIVSNILPIAKHYRFPWIMLHTMETERLFDSALELVFQSGVGEDTLNGWLER
ncbi:MAG: TIR domain-containing protein [Myxococcales bacterium]|nr:TIR domain-containing protein [Myxococcales bacterium]